MVPVEWFEAGFAARSLTGSHLQRRLHGRSTETTRDAQLGKPDGTGVDGPEIRPRSPVREVCGPLRSVDGGKPMAPRARKTPSSVEPALGALRSGQFGST
jgi:hypothetical protein